MTHLRVRRESCVPCLQTLYSGLQNTTAYLRMPSRQLVFYAPKLSITCHGTQRCISVSQAAILCSIHPSLFHATNDNGIFPCAKQSSYVPCHPKLSISWHVTSSFFGSEIRPPTGAIYQTVAQLRNLPSCVIYRTMVELCHLPSGAIYWTVVPIRV